MWTILLLYLPVIGAIIYLIYKNFTQYHDYFKQRHVAYLKPTLLGHTYQLFLKKTNPSAFLQKLNQNFPEQK